MPVFPGFLEIIRVVLLKNQENMLCGYVYFQKTSQNEMADFLKIDQAVLKNLMGSEKNTLVNFRSIGIEPKMRNKGLSEILFSFAIEYSQKILKADYMPVSYTHLTLPTICSV